ncbi:uncharacterized protein BCR38DRAFT_342643 [Pseudomassariella vexata]|uniref:Cyanovirin-N domain-containing protein n=1 Tax=Pseudomassariella vexata TaxID=1141098 RepID=A0A1Y2DYF8_9PEZI|nr:uncharacterized protein BCR38DRAFT_342643 [Pseudomassariella vexata]ORY64277.1 hypothetical protein BCR38DRAFT_342643 [Pseudomassariella vexata]
MKLLLLLTMTTGLIAPVSFEAEATRPHRKCHRPKQSTSTSPKQSARVPGTAPQAYKTNIGKSSLKRSKSSLSRLPAYLIDPDSADSSLRNLRFLKRQVTANDFYECQSANPAPAPTDCNIVIDQVYDANQNLIVTANSCLLFQYNSCWGFFCALCSQLTTSTDFIGNQLSSAESLCIENGQDGTIVGEDAPQWEAGFIYQGDGLPSYDVCGDMLNFASNE